jgi:hypothetical protein
MSASTNDSASPLVFVFDSVRTRSNLFFRWISTNGAMSPIHHPYSEAAMLGPERYTRHANLTAEEEEAYDARLQPFSVTDTYDDATRDFRNAVQKAQSQVSAES